MKTHDAVQVGDSWLVFAVGSDGQPTGAPLGAHTGEKDARSQVEALGAVPDRRSFAIAEGMKDSGFKVYDNGLWVAHYSNAAEDKEGEIFPRSRTDEYITRLDRKEVRMPELWGWHIPGSKHGQAEWVERVGLVTVAVGRFDDSPLANSFKEYYANNEVELSHGFTYVAREKQNGVYGTYDTFEISTLPLGRAANPYTSFEVKELMLTKEKVDWLTGIAGKDVARSVLLDSANRNKELEALGVRFKELAGEETKEDGKKMPPKKGMPMHGEPDADDEEEKKEIAAIKEALMTDVRAEIKALGDTIANALKPLGTVVASQKTDIATLTANVKGLAEILYNEFQFQPPATSAAKTLVSGSDPNMQLINAALQQQQQSGDKAFSDAYGGVFGEIFKAMSSGNKNLGAASAFEIPGSPSPMAQMPIIPQAATMPTPDPSQMPANVQAAVSSPDFGQMLARAMQQSGNGQ